ncbi:hypothetical protein [Methanoplanus limicola]|uniref:Uncharacterized protein n=1 Tax=Methanoplanus limicola DSM 2279 TaxID=937775 RepID=H1Z0D8_9EURY|nr:hypothetical protein [Methanoplanus limicola]EHQ34405.1 hypothetical protein Metlim_0258 [Methanoplanus limicola DSM 2279]
MISAEDYNYLINNYFLIVYADCLAYLGQKPVEVLIEMESAFMHFSIYSNEKNEEIRAENLQKAYNHIVRATLDCQKLIWLQMHELIEGIYKDPNLRKFCTNSTEQSFLAECNEFFELAKIARRDEINNIGKKPLKSIESYYHLLEKGHSILNSVDCDKKEQFNRYSKFLGIKKNIVELIISFAGGLISGVILMIILGP